MTEDRIAFLAERHRRVLRLYAQRYRLKEIARELSLSENSVNTYLTEAVQILQVGGRRAAADTLARHEGPSQLSRYPFSAPDTPVDPAPDEASQTAGDPLGDQNIRLPLRSRSGTPNSLPVHLRLLWMLAFLIILITGVTIAVAVYTVDVKPMEHLFRASRELGQTDQLERVMMNANLKIAQLARPRHPLRAMEDQIDRAISDNATVTIAMIDARQRAGLSAEQGHGLLHRNLEIGVELGRIRGETVTLHSDCLDFLRSSGDPERMYGDQWECPPAKNV
jgi:DNA-binding CsgD family transcriptional regulator